MEPLRGLWARALAPTEGFRARAACRPGLGRAVGEMLLVRSVPALAGLVFTYVAFAKGLSRFQGMTDPLWDLVWSRLPAGIDPGDLRAAVQGLPSLPGLGRVLPWMVLLAPLGILSLWLHDAVWDHLALWLLRGLAGRQSFRITLEAEAEALKVGVVGVLAGLVRYLPGVSFLVNLALLPLAVYFWILRGYALAAWHGCPVWKGVLATLLHAALMGLLVFGFLALVLLLVIQELHVT